MDLFTDPQLAAPFRVARSRHGRGTLEQRTPVITFFSAVKKHSHRITLVERVAGPRRVSTTSLRSPRRKKARAAGRAGVDHRPCGPVLTALSRRFEISPGRGT